MGPQEPREIRYTCTYTKIESIYLTKTKNNWVCIRLFSLGMCIVSKLQNCNGRICSGWTGEKICFVGDSAGANLVVGAALKIHCKNLKPPTGILAAYGTIVVFPAAWIIFMQIHLVPYIAI